MRTGLWADGAGERASWAVFDLGARRPVVERRAAEVFRSASVVKVLLALDFLRGVVSGRDRRLVEAMLRASDDAAADEVWERGGRGEIVERMVGRAGLRETVPPPADMPGWWGYTGMSAGDVVRVYRYALEVPEGRSVLRELRRMAVKGADGSDQVFGMAGVPGVWAVKQGWSGFGAADVRPVLHTSGVGEGKIVVVLSEYRAGTSREAAVERVTALARSVMGVTVGGRGSSPESQRNRSFRGGTEKTGKDPDW